MLREFGENHPESEYPGMLDEEGIVTEKCHKLLKQGKDTTSAMNYRRFNNKVFIRIDKGEEIVSTIQQLCKSLHITLGSITGIGAIDDITIGLMNTKTKKYQSMRFTGDHEISSLVGNITTIDGDIYLHLHITICNAEHKAFGGHLTSAVVSATFEGIIDIIDGQVNRKFGQTAGFNLLDL
jgi:hypothetical protein